MVDRRSQAEFDAFIASILRLQAAGIVGPIIHAGETGEGSIAFTPAAHRLLTAGRHIFSEPGFVAAWGTGDPALVRLWVESEAALLGEEPYGATDRTESREIDLLPQNPLWPRQPPRPKRPSDPGRHR